MQLERMAAARGATRRGAILCIRVALGTGLLGAGCTSEESDLPDCDEGQQLRFVDGSWSCADAPTLDGVDGADGLAGLRCNDGEVVLFEQGSPRCGAVASAEGGDITAVHTPSGSGLTGGDSSGEVTLGLEFAGGGSATTVARSDHAHPFSALTDVPGGFADRIDDDVLGGLSCSDGQVARFDAGTERWGCASIAGLSESDPSVNALGKTAALDACGADQVPVYASGTWSCGDLSDADSLAAVGPCSDGQAVVWQGAGFTCGPAPSATGDITTVTAGNGLAGGGFSGDVTLAVDFGGACGTGQAACSDHTHPVVTPTLDSVLGAGDSAGGQRIQNLAPPIGGEDAVTKAYVDALGSGNSGLALALCCGSECGGRLDDWECQDVDTAGQAVVPMPDARGMIIVPDTGQPTLITSGGTTQSLADCGDEWSVCTLDNVTSLVASCGLLTSANPATPWQCWLPTLSYFLSPGMAGMIATGDPGSPVIEYLADDGSAVAAPSSEVDCSGATPIDEPFPGSRIVLCVR